MNKCCELQVVHKDNVKLKLIIEEREVDRFFTDLMRGEVYHYPKSSKPKGVGIWINLAEIRYITVWEVEGDSGKNASIESIESIRARNGVPPSGEGPS
jgi:hypothetical protein